MAIVDFVQSNSNFLIWILGGFCGWIWWSIKTKFVTKETYQMLVGEVSELKNQVSGMPSQRDFHKMQLSLEHITGELATQNKTLSIIEKTLERQQDYLMGNK